MKKISFYCAHIVKSAVRYVLYFVRGGNFCVICGNKTSVAPLCRTCFRNMMLMSNGKRRCRICGKELLSMEEVCCSCRESSVIEHCDKVLPIFSYRLWNKELLYLWKIKGERSLSRVFAKVLDCELKNLSFDAIVPVPPRPGKIKEKGWDQIEDLVLYLEHFYGYKVLRLLERKTVFQQKKLDREERLASMESSYFFKSDDDLRKCLNNQSLPEKVCLIDDVSTTGATLERCSKILKEAGIKSVTGLTLFVVD